MTANDSPVPSKVTEAIGYASGFVIALSLVPAVWKAYTTKSTADISYGWSTTYIVGLLGFLAYSVLISSTPIVVSVSIETFLALSLVFLKVFYESEYYRRRHPHQHEQAHYQIQLAEDEA